MTFEEIIQALIARDERVTQCFFFWDGPTLEHIEAVRRDDPNKAARMRRPVCNTCRPLLLRVLSNIYGREPFNYNECVADLYIYIMAKDKLKTIKNPNTLMGWMATTAYYFFLNDKIKKDGLLEKPNDYSLDNVTVDIEDDETAKQIRDFVQEVLDAMPNREYAKILDEVTLEVAQYKGKEKSAKMKELSERMGIPIDNLYVKVSLAKKQFKTTAINLGLK